MFLILLSSLKPLQSTVPKSELFEKTVLPQKNKTRTETESQDYSDKGGGGGIFEKIDLPQRKKTKTKTETKDYSDKGGGGGDECELSRALQGLLRQQKKKKKKNAIKNRLWSTLSTYMTLSILYMGTTGTSKEQIGSLLGDKHYLVTEELHSWLVRSVCGRCDASKEAQLVLANAVLSKFTKENIKEEFLQNMAQEGRIGTNVSVSSMYHVEFEGVHDRLNSWANKTTGGMIQNIIKPEQVTSDTAILIINLLYFNGHWKTKFSPENTITSVFHSPEGAREVQLMYKKEEMVFGYDSSSEISWVELPYMGDKFAMVAYLAKDQGTNSTSKIEAALANMTVCEKQESIKTEVELYFPKFVLEYEEELSERLQEAGVKDVFQLGKANFSNMIKTTKEKMSVTGIMQTTKIQVDETGTKAAAATKVIVETDRMGGGEPLVMRFDRPFVFTIVSLPDRIPIFGGVVVDPVTDEDKDSEIDNNADGKTGNDYVYEEYVYEEPPSDAGKIIPLLDQFSWCDQKKPEMKRLLSLLETCNKYNISSHHCQDIQYSCKNEKQRRPKCVYYSKLCQDLLQLQNTCKEELVPLKSSHQKICQEIGTDVTPKVHEFWNEFSRKLNEELLKTDKLSLLR